MRVLFIDFNGTLDTVADMPSFIKTLKDQGDCLILMTGNTSGAIKALGETASEFAFIAAKPFNLPDLLRELGEEDRLGGNPTEVIVVDDSGPLVRSLVRCSRDALDIPIRGLGARDILELVT